MNHVMIYLELKKELMCSNWDSRLAKYLRAIDNDETERYWDYQDTLANLIKRRLDSDDSNIDIELLQEGLNRNFPGKNSGEINWQKCAAIAAVMKRFCVIAGGPGTGKTTTVIKILSLIQEQAHEKTLNIALAAPTGKAAARLKEVIQSAKKGLQCPDNVKRAIPEDAETIHRLLKSIPHSPYFRYNSKNLLPVDVMVVDEASMVDMALMTKLVQALPLESRLILLGDKDQLASVEAGAVFGDICAKINDEGYSRDFSRLIFSITGYKIHHVSHGKEVTAMRDPIIQLRKNYRFFKRFVRQFRGQRCIRNILNCANKQVLCFF